MHKGSVQSRVYQTLAGSASEQAGEFLTSVVGVGGGGVTVGGEGSELRIYWESRKL